MKYIHPKKYFRLTKEWLHDIFWYYLLPDSLYLKHRYKEVFGKSLNLKNPQTFNEKIQWMKLFDRKPIYHILVDKYRVKSLVSNLLGDEYIIPTIGKSFQKISEINKESLPNQFVLKCNHDSASVVICKDKTNFDWKLAEKKLYSCLKRDYYHFENKQWAYKDIDRCIFIEKYVEDSKLHDLPDYKFYCFNGWVKCIFVGHERFTNNQGVLVNLFDRNWNKLPFGHNHPSYNGYVTRPKQLDKMIEIAEYLAKYVGNPFIRIDLYEIDGHIYFGEFTFYPEGGMGYFQPKEWDQILGSWMQLPIDK